MLLRFTVENVASFREAAELSFVSTARNDEPEHRFRSRHAPHGVLPVVGVWGANASGKTNLFWAFGEFVSHVATSFAHRKPNDPVPWLPWRLDRSPGARPSMMSVDLVTAGDVRLHYGFRFRAEGYDEEWLYRWDGARRSVLFHRNHAEPEAWYFPGLKGQKNQIKDATRRNSLFLSAAAQHNHPELTSVWEAIVSSYTAERLIELHSHPLFAPDDPILAADFRPTLLKFLDAADTGIVDVRVQPVETVGGPREALEKIFTPEYLETIRGAAPSGHVEVRFVHRGQAGEDFTLLPHMESRGTQIMLARLADLVAVLRSGRLLLIDELDTSLHPDLCAALVELFTNPATNPNGAQLLFSTHDRGLLRSLRTDEVLLVDKDRTGCSHVAAASDYRGVRTRDDLRRAHEEGRLRGVPVLGPLGQIMSFELGRGR
jgi:hypothetical protein